MTKENVKEQLASYGSPERASHSKHFFKTGKGQYGEGDRFFGASVPEIRSVAKQHKHIPFPELEKLLHDEMHECRLCALVILVERFKKADEKTRELIYDFYLANTSRINNWDLVDLSCRDIVGEWLSDKDRSPLYRLAASESLWEQRIAVVSTFAFIRKNDFEDVVRLSEQFLTHKHDLIHKACGWMLREAGKRDETLLLRFLDKHAPQMPRTMLRYAIERLSPERRSHYMSV
ncbi:MAG: DNA alkylation repair protein [Dysgonamonadaceae bacterium]|jgi:3-methyladenine DNA glycosylase AlkD|nr:DNA alkylation repair protein [Dysgonamonadaceae bacterium]